MGLKKKNFLTSFLLSISLVIVAALPANILCFPARSPQIRIIQLKIAGDEEFRSQNQWQESIKKWISDISALFEQEFNIQFTIHSFENWTSSSPQHSFDVLFHDLRRNIQVGEAEIVLGFTDQPDLLSRTMGLASYLHGYALIKKSSSEDQTKRYLLHEICHLFGGVDLLQPSSVMRWDKPSYDFDDTTRRIIHLNRTRRFNPNTFPLSADQIDKAITIYQEIEESVQKDDVVPVVLATLFLEKEDYEAMLDTCLQARKKIPDSVEITHLLGIAYRRMGQIDRAIKEYKKVIREQPWLPDVYYNLGIAYKKKGDLEDSAKSYQKAVELNPHHAKAHSNLGLVYLEQGLPEKAIHECRKAISLYPELAEAYSTLGGAYLLLGKIDEAEFNSQKALSLNPKLPGAHNNLGTIYLKQKKTEQAIKEYERSIELNPDYHEALYNLGRAYYLKDSPDMAADYFLVAIEKNPEYFQAYSNLGLCYLKMGAVKDAEEACLKAIKINLDHANAHTTLALVYFLQDKLNRAEESALKAISLSPSLTEAHNLLGTLYEKKGNVSKAKQKYLLALNFNPDYLEAHLNLGNLYFKENLFDRSLIHYKRVLEIDPAQALTWNNMAVIYYLQENYSEAWASLHKAEELGFKVHADFKKQLKNKLKSCLPL
jgi:tetratricopeptide (TPR) repeat protein